jgi:tetratricopeptide (TPR) repeat protein
MESDGMLRHLAFFEELGRMDESEAGWRAVSAGLVAMRLVDRWIAAGSTARLDAWSVSAAREAVAQVEKTTPIRRILTSVLDVMVACTAADMHALSPRLMAYGQALEYEAKWSLAADVYTNIVMYTHHVDDADLVITASLQLGFCLRISGYLDKAAAAYAQACELASAANDLCGIIRGHMGDAKIAADRGNMPRAESILDEAIEKARTYGLDDVRSRALNDRAFVAGQRGQHDRVIRFSYDALSLSKSQRERDRILTNIATAFRYIGLLDVARDAHLVLASTAQEQFIRWNSALNLLDLAAQQESELQFDRYRRELEIADLSPQLRATYLLYVGRGYCLLHQSPLGIPYLEKAVEFAAEHRLNQLMFEAEEALSVAGREQRSVTPTPKWTNDATSFEDVVGAIQSMKEMAGID